MCVSGGHGGQVLVPCPWYVLPLSAEVAQAREWRPISYEEWAAKEGRCGLARKEGGALAGWGLGIFCVYRGVHLSATLSSACRCAG
jgi:hypothetical protein